MFFQRCSMFSRSMNSIYIHKFRFFMFSSFWGSQDSWPSAPVKSPETSKNMENLKTNCFMYINYFIDLENIEKLSFISTNLFAKLKKYIKPIFPMFSRLMNSSYIHKTMFFNIVHVFGGLRTLGRQLPSRVLRPSKTLKTLKNNFMYIN